MSPIPRILLAVAAVLALSGGTRTPARADTEVPADLSERAGDLMKLPVAVTAIDDLVLRASGIGNVFLVKTPGGNVVYDTGVPWQGAEQREQLLAAAAGRVSHVVVSHAHADHNGGLEAWQGDFERGTELIAHERYPYTNRIYGDTEPYLWRVRTGSMYPVPDKSGHRNVVPSRLVPVSSGYSFEVGGVDFVAIAARNSAEGEDALLLWLPDHGILFSGDFFGPLYPMFPNLYTIRGEKLRDPLDYVDSLDRLLALRPRPKLLLPAHFDEVEGVEYIQRTLEVTRDATQYVYDETVKGMNAGRSVYQLMAEIELPPELRISQGHGKVSWSVRAIWELLAGWFSFEDTADLYPVPVRAVHADVVELAGGTGPLVTRARSWLERGEPVKALRLLDIARGGSGGQPFPGDDVRLAALEALLAESRATTGNFSETSFLGARISAARSRIAAASP